MTPDKNKPVDHPGKAFCQCTGGGTDLCQLDHPDFVKAGYNKGPVRLQVGFPGAKGYGLAHIEDYSDRVKQIQGLGLRTVQAFCEQVAANYTHIGRVRDGRVVLLQKTPAHDLQLVLEWKDEGYWTIVTGVPARVAHKFELICEVVRTGGSESPPIDAKRPRFATLSLPKK